MVVIDEIEDEDLFCPVVCWAQRKETISIKVNVSNAENPKINMTETSFSLQVKGNGARGLHMYKFQLDFFKAIDTDSCVYKISPSYIDIHLTKQGPGEWWPRLLPENVKKPHYLKLDFDRWKSESDDEEVEEDPNEEQMEQLKQALQADVDRQQDLMFSKKFYLFLYNGIQFLIFFTITVSCLFGVAVHRRAYFARAYHALGSMVVFAVLLTSLEVVHSFFGVVKSPWIPSFVMTTGRCLALLALWAGGRDVQMMAGVWFLYFAWSAAESIRYPVYLLQIVNREVKLLTWLRYHAWMVLFPIGGYCEYEIVTSSAAALRQNNLYSFTLPGTSVILDLSAFMRIYGVVIVLGISMMMRHMWKMRSRKFGGRRKLKPA